MDNSSSPRARRRSDLPGESGTIHLLMEGFADAIHVGIDSSPDPCDHDGHDPPIAQQGDP